MSVRNAIRSGLLLALAVCLCSPSLMGQSWTTHHTECSDAVLMGAPSVLTGEHAFHTPDHWMVVFEYCFAGNPPAYNLIVGRIWDGEPVISEPHQV